MATASTDGGAGTGISLSGASGVNWGWAVNNIVEGFSGTGGKGVAATGGISGLWGNAYYNNATNESLAANLLKSSNCDTLAASAYTNAGSANFAVNGTVAGVTEDAFPSGFGGTTTNKADKGAVQAGAGTAGGGGPVFGGMVVR